MVSAGEYTTAPLEVWPSGLQLPNRSGSICGVSGRGFLHGVAESDGPRISHVIYMRKDLQEYTGVKPCPFMEQTVYNDYLGTLPDPSNFLINEDPFCI